ncbi:ABC-type polysaccharide transport system permease subunit [Paenibacillus sp. V4I9]|uniref:hypothetical protein n=1 Tax=Paenibacillus sp. V4I9 TaxID=3042308 RepID=UPI00278BA172|nr:hypothetical protein [Paenibacillus sp. V4I9]MDQ0886850.1 ABC-type polysaccharide transport system permease subunit [Paenibacillus sp. V4I9]
MDTTKKVAFADADEIPAWAKTYFTAASEANWVGMAHFKRLFTYPEFIIILKTNG